MNILLTSHFFYPSIGGIESITEVLAYHFHRSGHSLRLVTKSKGDMLDDISRYPFEIIRNPSLSRLLECFKWSHIILQNNIELLQLWPIIFVKKPIVIGLQTWIRSSDGRRGLFEYVKCLSLHIAKHVIACSECIRDDTFSNASVIGNPYDSELFRNIFIKRKEKSIVFLGRLVSDKGVDLLIKSFAELKLLNANLTIIGNGPELQNLYKLVNHLGIQESVVFVGALQGYELVKLLNQHEIMVVPSIWREPFGIVALEGMACGCVILASDDGGLTDAVGPSGLLFKRGDLKDLTRKLRLLLTSPQLRSKLRDNAPNHLLRFSKDKVCDGYLSILQRYTKSIF